MTASRILIVLALAVCTTLFWGCLELVTAMNQTFSQSQDYHNFPTWLFGASYIPFLTGFIVALFSGYFAWHGRHRWWTGIIIAIIFFLLGPWTIVGMNYILFQKHIADEFSESPQALTTPNGCTPIQTVVLGGMETTL